MRIAVVTAEPENYVPVELAKNAQGHEVKIIDTNKCAMLVNGVVMFDGVEVKDFDMCIPRLNDELLDQKYQLLLAIEAKTKMLNSAIGMKICQDKLETLNAVDRYIVSSGVDKVRQPKTALVTDPEQADAALSLIAEDGPYVIKTVLGSQGMGVMLADSKLSARGIVQYLVNQSTNLMIQEFIKHDKSYRIITLGDRMLACNVRGQKGDKDFRTNIAQGAESDKYEPSQKEIDVSLAIAKHLNCQFVAIDYLLDGDDMVILEVNGSPGLEDMQTKYEENLCAAVITHCAGGKIADLPAAPEITPPTENPEPVKEPEAEKPVINQTEKIILKRIGSGNPIEAKVDTGADSCSLHGENIVLDENAETVEFDFDGARYKMWLDKTVKVKNANDAMTRPRVLLSVDFLGKTYTEIETTIADRSTMEYEFLIGRNLLEKAGVSIQISAPDSDKKEEE